VTGRLQEGELKALGELVDSAGLLLSKHVDKAKQQHERLAAVRTRQSELEARLLRVVAQFEVLNVSPD
jgi:hypothetical protein